MPTKKTSDQLLIFVNLDQHVKNQFIHLSILQIQSILKSHHMTGHTQFMPTPKTFKLILMKLYQHVKIKLILLANSILESSEQIGHIKC